MKRPTFRSLVSVFIGLVLAYTVLYILPVGWSLAPEPTPTPDRIGWRSYTNSKFGISFKHPPEFQVQPGQPGPRAEWELSGLGQGTEVVSLHVTRSYQPRTNFVGASMHIGSAPQTGQECLDPPAAFGYKNSYRQRMIGDIKFQTFTGADAGAGNFYEFTSYRTIRDGVCLVFEYSIQRSSLENYPDERGIKEFNRPAIINVLEGILDTVQLSQ